MHKSIIFIELYSISIIPIFNSIFITKRTQSQIAYPKIRRGEFFFIGE